MNVQSSFSTSRRALRLLAFTVLASLTTGQTACVEKGPANNSNASSGSTDSTADGRVSGSSDAANTDSAGSDQTSTGTSDTIGSQAGSGSAQTSKSSLTSSRVPTSAEKADKAPSSESSAEDSSTERTHSSSTRTTTTQAQTSQSTQSMPRKASTPPASGPRTRQSQYGTGADTSDVSSGGASNQNMSQVESPNSDFSGTSLGEPIQAEFGQGQDGHTGVAVSGDTASAMAQSPSFNEYPAGAITDRSFGQHKKQSPNSEPATTHSGATGSDVTTEEE